MYIIHHGGVPSYSSDMYIPNFLRRFKCQKFGHAQNSCKGQQLCTRCATPDHETENCNNEPNCVKRYFYLYPFLGNSPTSQTARQTFTLSGSYGAHSCKDVSVFLDFR